MKKILCLTIVCSLATFAGSNDEFELPNAIATGNLKKANALLSNKSSIDFKGSIGSAALSRAFDKVIGYNKNMQITGVDENYAKIIRSLLQLGARSNEGYNAFYDHFKTAFKEHKLTHNRFISADAQQNLINFIHEVENFSQNSENIPQNNNRR